MPVYIIRAGESGPVKIGFAESVGSRIIKMQSDNHERLAILRIFEGGKDAELLLHTRFAAQWMRGEWFTFSDAMLGDVGLTEIVAPESPMQEIPNTVPATAKDIIKALGGPVKLARQLGIERPTPATLHWHARGIPPRYWHRIAELLAACGIEFTAHDIERTAPSQSAEAA